MKSTCSATSRPIIDEVLLARIFLAGVISVGVMTWLFGITPGQVRLVPCPIHTVTGFECPGCVMTRACTAVGQGQFVEAWGYHPLVFGLVLLALAYAVFPAAIRQTWQRLPGWSRAAILGTAFVCVLGVWLC